MKSVAGLLDVKLVAQDWFVWVEESNEIDEMNESKDGMTEDDLWALTISESLID